MQARFLMFFAVCLPWAGMAQSQANSTAAAPARPAMPGVRPAISPAPAKPLADQTGKPPAPARPAMPKKAAAEARPAAPMVQPAAPAPATPMARPASPAPAKPGGAAASAIRPGAPARPAVPPRPAAN